jgi:aminoglycoside phosphotransferase (APT) family kinase protein
MPGADLLDADTVVAYLRHRQLLKGSAEPTVSVLSGGVSSVALLVRAGDRAMVVKQALPKLRVEADWRASRERTLTEAAALLVYERLTPHAVPRVLDTDPSTFALTMEAVPPGLRLWKTLLLEGEVDSRVAAQLGSTLGRWHALTANDAEIARRFGDRTVFMQLRIEPFYEAVAARHPRLAPAIEDTVEATLADQRCLVHGDFSPKNVLVDHERAVVLDCEVAHLGDPSFDVAFLLHHLALKVLARPAAGARLQACATRFLRCYERRVGTPGRLDQTRLLRHTACLMLARVDGKSPVEYLDELQRDQVRAVTGHLLRLGKQGSTADLWRALRGGSGR